MRVVRALAAVVVLVAVATAGQPEETEQTPSDSADKAVLRVVGGSPEALPSARRGLPVSLDESGALLLDTNLGYTTVPGTYPASASGSANYLIAWMEVRNGSDYDICAARVTHSGELLDSAGIVVSGAPGSQGLPSVAFDGTNYLVAWDDTRPHAQQKDIYVARVSQSGTVLDPSGIRLPSSGSGADYASVAFDGTNYLVVWSDSRGGSKDVVGARVSQAGVVLDATAISISTASGNQTAPSVAFGGGNYFVAWHDYTSGDVYGARVTAAGTVLDPAGIPIAAGPAYEGLPSVTFSGVNYLVVWEDGRGSGYDIYGSRVSTAGSVLDPSGIAISTAASDQRYPSVSAGSSGFLVVWNDLRNGTEAAVYGARVSLAGSVLDPTGIPVADWPGSHSVPQVCFDGTNYLTTYSNTSGAGGTCATRVSQAGTVLDPNGIGVLFSAYSQLWPAVAFDGTGYVAVWEDARNSRERDIFGTRVASDSSVVDPAGIEIAAAPGGQGSAAIAFGGSNYLAVWTDSRNGNWDIYGARVSASGAVLDPVAIPISTAASGQGSPTVAFDGTNYFVVWEDRPTVADEIYGARVSQSGVVLDPGGIPIATGSGYRRNPSVAFDGTNFVVVWSGLDVYGVRVSSGGVVLDPAGIAISTAANDQSSAVIASDGTGSLVVWVDYRSGRSDIYGSRLSSAGVVLDPSGILICGAAYDQIGPAVAFGGGSYVVVWMDSRSDLNWDIHGAVVGPAGALVSSFVLANDPGVQARPALAMGADDQMLVVYYSMVDSLEGRPANSPRIWGRFVMCRIADAGVVQLLSPTTGSWVGAPAATITPAAVVRNDGSQAEAIPAAFVVSGPTNWTDPTGLSAVLSPGSSGTITFATSPGLAAGYYQIYCKTTLGGDVDPTDDSLGGSFLVMDSAAGLSPDGGAWFGSSPVLSCNTLDGVQSTGGYVFQCATDPGFTANLHAYASDGPSTPTALPDADAWYWRVRGRNVILGPWSAAATFRLDATPPSAPGLISPSDGATGVALRPTFEWSAVTLNRLAPAGKTKSGLTDAAPVSYHLQVATDAGFTSMVVDAPALGGTSHAVTSDLGYLSQYHWRVNATDEAGNDGPWGGPSGFTTVVQAPGTVTLTVPANGATGISTSGSLIWQPSERASIYDIYMDQNPTPTTLLAATTGTSQVYAGISPQTTYFWRVVARNDGGESQSAVWYFTTSSGTTPAGGWSTLSDSMTGSPVKDGGGLAFSSDDGRIYELKGNKTLDFNAYDPADSSWHSLVGVPAGSRPVSKGASITAGAGFVYVMKGNNTREFYKYDVVGGWAPALRQIPLALDQSATRGKNVKAGGSLAYVDKGDTDFVYVLKGSGTDFYRYDVTRDTFRSLVAAPYSQRAKYDKGSWIVYDGSRYIYLMQAKYNALFRYDVTSEAWDGTSLTGMPFNSTVTGKSNKKVGDGSSAASDGTVIRALKGNNTQEWWQYTPSTGAGAWAELESIPQAYTGGMKKKPKSGAGLAYYPNTGVFYAQKGNKSNQFWMYSPGGLDVSGLTRQAGRDGVLASGVEREESRVLRITPNPLRSGVLHLSTGPLDCRATLTIYDIAGRCVLTRTIGPMNPGALSLDLRHLSAGVYLVRLNSDTYTAGRKLVIER